jgi:hypothetical protein
VEHRTLSGAQAEAPRELAALGFSKSHSIIIHRTVRCAPDCPVSQWSKGQLRPTVDCVDGRNNEQCGSQKSERSGLSGVPPDYPVPQEDKGLIRSSAPNPNGWLMWQSPDNEQCHV